MDDETPQSKGGKARAGKLSSIQRRNIASDAARARWNAVEGLPQVAFSGTLKIGDVDLPCAVLSDGRRVLSETGITKALFGAISGASLRAKKATESGEAPLPVFLAPKQLNSFITNDLRGKPLEPIKYQDGKRKGLGYDPRILTAVCDIWVKAKKAGALQSHQFDKAKRAEHLMRALADIAIIALVDEATGYQEKRAKDELQKILAAYISPTLLPWTERFPVEFFKSMFRVWGWAWPADGDEYKGPVGPRYAGKLIKQVIYGNLPPGVLEDLEKKNPADEKWQRRNRMPQLLTEDFGNPHVEKLVAVIHTIFEISDNKADFWRHYRRRFPKSGDQLELLPNE